MKAIASILCLYLFGLCVQPALFPLLPKEHKVMSCCKKGKTTKHKGCAGDEKGCCDDGQCNPFFSRCPVCAATAVVTSNFSLDERQVLPVSNEFFSASNNMISNYYADILRPPQYA